MTRIVKVSKKAVGIYGCLLILLPMFAVVIASSIQTKNMRSTITNREAARMLMTVIASQLEEEEILSDDGYYVALLNDTGCYEITDGQAQVTYGMLQEITEFYMEQVPEKLRDFRPSKVVSRQVFLEIFQELLPFLPFGNEVHTVEQDIAGLEETSVDGLYQVYTPEGIFYGQQENLHLQENKTYAMTVRDQYILFSEEIDGEVFFENVLMTENGSQNLTMDLYGVLRTFAVKGVEELTAPILCDVKITEGKITQLDLKTDTITGKVLSVSSDSVDIEGYGKVPLDENFIMYDIFDYGVMKDSTGIIVGYALQDFIVARGSICGAFISHKLNATNIRVMIMTTSFQSLFHENVEITSTEGFSMNTEQENVHFLGGETLLLNREVLQEQRVRIVPDGTNKLQVNTVKRSQGNPEYAGILEVEAYDEGLVLINDVNIEEYVSKVIPSEMPTGFGVSALKVQAVCARSYAYKELTNTAYSQYGAHVDDSIQYQVYNNNSDNETANEAARQTEGQVLMYGDEVVQTYYYSTSCGMTTDVSLWGSDSNAYPYYKSVSVGSQSHEGCTASEEAFFQFITTVHAADYDSAFPLYRWNMTVDVENMGNSIGAKIGRTIGKVVNIQVNKRVSGGALSNVTIVGTEGEVTLEKESDIRTVLGNGSVDLNTQSGVARYERLPSSFITFAPSYDANGAITAYTIYGGGYGHGIGMSQNAVKAMIETMDYKEILQVFYPETRVETISEDAHT